MTDIMTIAKQRAERFDVRNVLVATNSGASVRRAYETFGSQYQIFAVGNPASAHERGLVWKEIPLAFPQNARMIGVIDMVCAIHSGRPHRVSGDLAYHVLEVMTAFDRSSQSGQLLCEAKESSHRNAKYPTDPIPNPLVITMTVHEKTLNSHEFCSYVDT